MEQRKQPDLNLIIQSLQQQMMEQTMMIAERDAYINELHQELGEVKKSHADD